MVHAMARSLEEFQSLKDAYVKNANDPVKFGAFNCYLI